MLLLSTVCLAAPPLQSLWTTSDDPAFEQLRGWSNKVELGDVDGDGDLDVVIPNGGDYSNAGKPEPSVILLNDGAATFTSLELPELTGLHRVAKVRDFDGDGHPDVFLGGAWQAPSMLLLGDGAGGFVDGSDHLPTDKLSIGDAEPGDVDDDGDLDLVLADSGPGNALASQGGVTRLWRNDGTGHFTDDTAASMPSQKVRWSWDLELLDVDGDFDLDLAISCKTCTTQYLLLNDGTGLFAPAPTPLPPSSNNYDFEGLDLTGDGFLDLVTINDGPQISERILVGDGAGAFDDQSADRIPLAGNAGVDDNVAVLLDFDDDGDVDDLVGSLSGPDRLFVNDGTGYFTVQTGLYSGPNSSGTLGMAAGDLNGDGKPDLVDVQGESAFPDFLRLGDGVPADTQPPEIGALETFAAAPTEPFVVRVHADDRITPIGPDTLAVTLEYTTDAGTGSISMTHVGHTLYRAVVDGLDAGSTGTWHVCATDRASNQLCADDVAFSIAGGTTPGETGDTGAGTTPTTPTTATPTDTGSPPPKGSDNPKGCGCGTSGTASGGVAALVAALLGARRRRSVA